MVKCEWKKVWHRTKLFQSVKHLPLHPVLQLSAPDHEVDDLLDGRLGILLLDEVLDDGVFRDLRADGEPTLELLLDPVQHLLVLLGGEAFSSRQAAGCGGLQG